MRASLGQPVKRARSVFALLLASLLFLVSCDSAPPPVRPPLEIEVVEVVQRDQPIEMEMVGQTLGSSDIPIRARVAGVLTSMDFVEGRTVKEGQLLYTIDPDPFRLEVVEAEGSVAEVKTMLAKAKSDLGRIRPLAEISAVSQADLDSAVAQYEATLGTLQSARARVEQANIRLGYARIHSPISGRVGISKARVGEFVGVDPNPVVLNFVSKIDPIRVRFSIDERTYLRIARRLHDLRHVPGEEPAMGKGLTLTLADGVEHPHRGSVVGSDAAVDPNTGTFTLEADFPNPDRVVLAGQFARVGAVVQTRVGALLIPSRSVSELQGKFRVFVVAEDGKVEMRSVKLGPVIDSLRIVDSGLKPGEHVAVEIMKLRPGITVKPKLVTLNKNGTIVDPKKGS